MKVKRRLLIVVLDNSCATDFALALFFVLFNSASYLKFANFFLKGVNNSI
jgi:hypothetical protein